MNNVNEFPLMLMGAKAFAAVLMVVLLSVLAEVVSTRLAGILSGYPLGAAISLFFMGYEIDPQFASQSALHTSVGLIATQAFAYAYYRTSLAVTSAGRVRRILAASFGGLAGYFLAACLLRGLQVTLASALVLPTLFILLFLHLFRHIENRGIRHRAPLDMRILLLRAVFAATAVVAITSSARWLGPSWAGILAAFPITLLPFVAIIHYTYDLEHVHAILKNVPKGLGSLVVYSLTVSMLYPACGVVQGTLWAYGLATLYLVMTQMRFGRSV